MKNNKGFTVVELSVSFCLIATIAILLFQIIISLKEVYTSGDIKTGLLTKQGMMTKKIKEDLNNKNLTSVTSCGDYCITFTFESETKNLEIDKTNNTIIYDNYSLKLNNSSKFGIITGSIYNGTNTSGNNSILNIKIPIINSIVDGDYGINIVHQFNSNNVTINISNNIIS